MGKSILAWWLIPESVEHRDEQIILTVQGFRLIHPIAQRNRHWPTRDIAYTIERWIWDGERVRFASVVKTVPLTNWGRTQPFKDQASDHAAHPPELLVHGGQFVWLSEREFRRWRWPFGRFTGA